MINFRTGRFGSTPLRACSASEEYPASQAPVKITRVIRRMRGGSQAQLVQGDDGNTYVAKFLGNPQGNRTLVNEWIIGRLMTHMDISTPRLRVLELPSFLQSSEELHFVVGNKHVAPQGLLHLGSQCPVDPEKTAIFDFLPGKLLRKVHNLAEFGTMFVFDIWTGKTDERQAIFVRDQDVNTGIGFRGYFIDHGSACGGGDWQLRDLAPVWPRIIRSRIYSNFDLSVAVEEAVCQIENINERGIATAAEGVPSSWFAPGDQEGLDTLLIKLRQRQMNLRPLIARHLPVLCAYADAAPPQV